jgi:DNA-binding transcriptional ArsR family regulator
MLAYLVTSRARRGLLEALWREGARGSVSELARVVGVSFSSAYEELEAMRAAGLAAKERQGKRLVYGARPDHPDADLLMRLLVKREPEPLGERQSRLRHMEEKLTALGAPFLAPPRKTAGESTEQTLADALVLAHESGQLAEMLPYVLWFNRERMNLGQLVEEATRRDERATLGLLLELAGKLGHAPELVRAASELGDRRRRRVRQFFTRASGRWAAAVARLNTPSVARRWGYLMNMPLESFESVFRTFARA